ncbi:LytTR family DNA-binding domain-containing protein [Lachnospiraceae bacterium 66-29]
MNGFPSMKRITIWIEDKKAFQSSWNVLLADMTGGGDKMIHIAICDDETCMSDTIRKMVSDFFGMKNTEITIVQFSSGEELLSYEKSIDILFLDIQMKDIDGMETARMLRKRKFEGFLIFITILKEMVFQCFEVQAYDYLVKPIEERYFIKTMERLYASIQNASEANLLVRRGYESRIISLQDIVFGEIIDRKVYLHLTSSEVIDFYDRIEHLEQQLDQRFFRCHRSYLINLKYLKSYKKGIAYMEGGKEIPVSRLRSKEFSSVILQYMKSM